MEASPAVTDGLGIRPLRRFGTAARLLRPADRFAVPLAVFGFTHLVFAGIGLAASRILSAPAIRANATVLPHSDIVARLGSGAAAWFRFDAYWFVNVAQHGYHWAGAGRANTNFLPLYPALIRILEPLTFGSPWAAAWLISNLFSLVALVLLWQWARERWEREVAVRVLILFAVFPFAFFFVAPYSESLFVTLVLAAFLYAEKERWMAAAVVASLAVMTRPTGPALVAALLVLAWQRRSSKGVMFTAAALLPLLGFAVYVGVLTGHPHAIVNYHSAGWVTPHGGLLTTITSQFHTKLSPFDRIDALVSLLFLGSSLLVWKRLGAQYAVYVAVGTLLPLTRGLAGMERYVIVLFPVMALWAQASSTIVQKLVFIGSVTGLVLFTTMFTAGYTLT